MRISALRSGEVVLRTFVRGLYALLLLVARGVLAWVYLPAGAAIWAIRQGDRGQGDVSLTHFLRWIDVNVVVALRRPARGLFDEQTGWVDLSDPVLDDHRILS